ncbi:radical SAM family heme chaperone HemW [Butyricimonas synergistica]|uniref:radical SAM family heme chaperone HemW n=1 Tax=Butyricimonas synergistica TaxID=544644 RepID=UPI00036F3AC3|nr:radical SAM family heme chaperone HemW [Butyricimonas synergistica]
MGIYVHVPFCRSKCFYCGFYSVASLKLKEAYLGAVEREIALREGYLPERRVSTVYFGGGTPSYLERGELQRIVDALERHYDILPGAERTIELNPEDLTRERFAGIRDMGFNRLSVGVQSFSDDHLKQINRTHTGRQAMEGVRLAADMGFDNISVDLIIGLPGQTEGELLEDMAVVNRLPIKHLSVYMLSIDSNTVFEVMVRQGKFKLEDEEVMARRYGVVCKCLKDMGFEHYEISNFAREGKYSFHNTSYWQQKPYIGFGPSAHSYDLHSRQWNTANLKTYIESLGDGILSFEKEELTDVDLYNEYVMTNLRTMWGIDTAKVEGEYGMFWQQVGGALRKYLDSGDLVERDGKLRISESGWVISDAILSDLFVV